MKVLLDTCTFLWLVTDDRELSDLARDVFESPENEVFLSTVSAWEIAVKHGLGRLPLPEAPATYVPRLRRQHGVEPLALDENAAFHLIRLPPLHRDPFDRMLVCQAIVEGMVVLTPDAAVNQYPVRTMW